MQLFGELACRAARARPAGGREAERGVVRKPDRLVERVNDHDGQERPESLVAHGVHGVVDAREDRRREPPAFRLRTLSSHEDSRALRYGILEMLLDEIPLARGKRQNL